MSRHFRFLIPALLAFGSISPTPLDAQDPPVAPEAPAPPKESKTISTITTIRESIRSVTESLKSANEELKAATTEAEKAEITKRIAELSETRSRLNRELQGFITGIDLEKFNNPSGEEFDVSLELRELFRPLLVEFKDATAKPRELENLRSLVAYHEQRLELAKKAVEKIKGLVDEAKDEALKKSLSDELQKWTDNQAQIEGDLSLASIRLEEVESSSSSLFGSFTESITNFAKTRGRNLLFAFVIGLVVFFLLRFAHRLIHRLGPFKRRGKRSFGVRLIDVGYYVFNIFAAAIAAMLTLYVLGDWIMLGLSILLIVGIIWTGKTALPLVYEQAKLMLNLGSVREGERIMYDGIPWEVRSINIYTDLVNHELDGGEIRLPLKNLVSLHSRPFKSQELFFPCKKGEWIILPDGRRGKVVAQTPDWVQLIHLGGSRSTFATSEFATLQPQNISTNFRVRESFGVDYQHQAISTTEIPEILTKLLTEELTEIVGKENLINLSVEFKTAGASSLDYAILADFSGEVAASYDRLHRAIQRICVNACNEHGWVIPFTQITVHNAA